MSKFLVTAALSATLVLAGCGSTNNKAAVSPGTNHIPVNETPYVWDDSKSMALNYALMSGVPKGLKDAEVPENVQNRVTGGEMALGAAALTLTHSLGMGLISLFMDSGIDDSNKWHTVLMKEIPNTSNITSMTMNEANGFIKEDIIKSLHNVNTNIEFVNESVSPLKSNQFNYLYVGGTCSATKEIKKRLISYSYEKDKYIGCIVIWDITLSRSPSNNVIVNAELKSYGMSADYELAKDFNGISIVSGMRDFGSKKPKSERYKGLGFPILVKDHKGYYFNNSDKSFDL